MGEYFLQPPEGRAIFLHNGLHCNDTRYVSGGCITYWGGGGGGGVVDRNENDPSRLLISAIQSRRVMLSFQPISQVKMFPLS